MGTTCASRRTRRCDCAQTGESELHVKDTPRAVCTFGLSSPGVHSPRQLIPATLADKRLPTTSVCQNPRPNHCTPQCRSGAHPPCLGDPGAADRLRPLPQSPRVLAAADVAHVPPEPSAPHHCPPCREQQSPLHPGVSQETAHWSPAHGRRFPKLPVALLPLPTLLAGQVQTRGSLPS